MNARAAAFLTIALFTAAPASAAMPVPAAAARSAQALSPVVYAVVINGVSVDSGAILLRSREGRLYARQSDVVTWHIRVPANVPEVAYGGDIYIPLDALHAIGLTIDPGKSLLSFGLGTHEFAKTVTDARYFSGHRAQRGTGAFLNYDVFAEKYFSQFGITSSFESGVATNAGVFLNTVNAGVASGVKTFQRIATTFVRDDVARLRTLRFGDTTSAPDDVGRAVNLAGVTVGTNFDLDPSYAWYPGVSVSGSAAVPSTLDLFVNNVQSLQKNVEPGAYEITNIPVIDGAGNITVLVTDASGARHYETMPYYFTRAVLKKGVRDASASAGFLHTGYNNLGTYGPAVAMYSERYGFTNSFTGGVHVETGGGRTLAGVTSDFVLSKLGDFSAALAESSGTLGTGALEHLAWSYQSPRYRFGATWESRQNGYHAADSIGPFGNVYAGQTLQLSTGLHLDRRTFASVTYSATNQNAGLETNNLKFIEATVTSQLYDGTQRSITAYRTIGNGGFGVQANITLAVGGRRFVSETAGNGRTGVNGMEARMDLPDSGYGTSYDIQTPWPRPGLTDVNVYDVTTKGQYVLDAQYGPGQQLIQGEAMGGVVFAGGHALATQTVNSAFGVVEVPNEKGVPVYVDNRFVGVTDKHGDVAVPFLAPYADNEIRIDSAKLPLSVDVPDTHKTVTPYDYNAAVVKYDVTASGGITLSLRLPAGTVVPAGSVARIVGSSLTSPVAANGIVYFSPVSPGAASIEVTMGVNGTCHATIAVPQDTTMQPDLGPAVCN